MKILIVNGAPHKGNTWRLTEIVREQMLENDKDIEFEEIHLIEEEIPFCIGCSLCFRKGHKLCPHNQYVQHIMDKIEWCDGLIFSISCFQGAPPALTKNFTDHLAFMLHRPRYFNKKALVISTTGGVAAKDATQSLANTLPGWGFNRCYQLPIIALSWNDYKPTEKHIQKAYKVSKAFYEDLKSNKLHAPSIGVLIPFNLFQAMCSDNMSGDEYVTEDKAFWKRYHGMPYADGIPMPLHKKIVAKLIYRIGKILSSHILVTYKK